MIPATRVSHFVVKKKNADELAFSEKNDGQNISLDLLKELYRMVKLPVSIYNQYLLYRYIIGQPNEKTQDLITTYFYERDKLVGIYNIWPILYSLSWKKVETPKKFFSESDNCIYTFLPVVSKDDVMNTLFVKMVNITKIVSDDFDNPLLDNYNGRILNRICSVNPDILKSIVVYIFSFNMCAFQGSHGEVKWPLDSLLNLKSRKCPLSANFDTSSYDMNHHYVASVFDTVVGVSLKDAIGATPSLDSLHNLIGKLPPFFARFQELGLKYGMLHNDLHAGNVHYDTTTQEFVLLDYGHMTFPSEVVQQLVNMDDIEQDEKNRNFWHYEYKYEDLASQFNRALKHTPADHFYFTHILDFMTLVTNIHYAIKRRTNIMGTPWEHFTNILDIDGTRDRAGSYLLVPTSFDKLQEAFLQAHENISRSFVGNPTLIEGMNLLAEGLFYMAAFLIHLYQTNKAIHRLSILSKNANGVESYKIPLAELVSSKVCMHNFQFYRFNASNDPHNFYAYLTNLTTDSVATRTSILKKLTGNNNKKGGAKKKQRMTGGTFMNELPLRNNAKVGINMVKTMLENEHERAVEQQQQQKSPSSSTSLSTKGASATKSASAKQR